MRKILLLSSFSCLLLCGCHDEVQNEMLSSSIQNKGEELCKYMKIDKNSNQYILTIDEKEALEKGFSKEMFHTFSENVNISNENIRTAIAEGRAVSLILSHENLKDVHNVNLGNYIEYDPDTVSTTISRGLQSYFYISISNNTYSKWNAEFVAPEKIATRISVSGAKSGESIVIQCNNGTTAYGSTIQTYIYGTSLTEVKYWWNTKSNNESGGGSTDGGGSSGGGGTSPSDYILNIQPGELDIKAGQEVYVGLNKQITPKASVTLYNWDFELKGVAPNGYGGISFTEQ